MPNTTWQAQLLAQLRTWIQEADPAIVEERRGENVAWVRDGVVCVAEALPAVVRLTFPKGAFLKDPTGLLTVVLEGSKRAIDFQQGAQVDETAFKNLIIDAVWFNQFGPPPQ